MSSLLENELHKILPIERVKTKAIDLAAAASDAGFYKLTPKAVVNPANEDEVVQLFTLSHRHNIPLVFRTGGTSLSGQAITNGILVDLAPLWKNVQVEYQGEFIRLQPGVIGAVANLHLKKHGRKIGPDPSSIHAAMVGGILSNNSSGMCCGVKHNSYHTLKHIRFILPNGEVYSTENPTDFQRFAKSPLGKGITELKNQIIVNTELTQKIRQKYAIKNTVGYSLNAFLDFEHPLDIFSHLLIGAEGTLAFISEAVMHTLPDYPVKATAMLYFDSTAKACEAIEPLIHIGTEAVELMDRASLRSIENSKDAPAVLKELPEHAAALLIEMQGHTPQEVAQKIQLFYTAAQKFQLLNEAKFTQNPIEQAALWKLRKGMFPAVGAVRAQGTTVILEDVAFPVANLGNAIGDLQKLFNKYEYANAIIFGHAKDGNIHFVITQSFATENEVNRYAAFMNEVVNLVVKKYNGALKAEHGTGRNMAPFVETEWGSDAYHIMQRLKSLADPENLLNPGVIINADKQAHLKNLKPLPTVEPEVDKCIECGYCEPKCPSRNLTLSPRKRITLRRELALLKAQNDYKTVKSILKHYSYQALDTCAVDGLCATDCPVNINTGELVKRLRNENLHPLAQKVALLMARNFSVVFNGIKFGVKFAHIINGFFGKKTVTRLTYAIKKVGKGFPLWNENILPSSFTIPKKTENAEYVYFPACINQAMGGIPNGKDIVTTFLSVCQKSGINVQLAENLLANCCGQPFSSKGFNHAYSHTANLWVEKAWQGTKQGKLPIVCDLSSCTYTLLQSEYALTPQNKEKFRKLTLFDSVDFLHDVVLPKVKPVKTEQKIALHPACSVIKMNRQHKFEAIAKAIGTQIHIPVYAGCCGMAGDRGFLFPELTQSATLQEANEVKVNEVEVGYSSSKTCEWALTDATHVSYRSILYAVDEAIGCSEQ